MTREQFLDSLRQALRLFELHPELPTPNSFNLDVWLYQKEDMASVARQLGSVEKEYQDNFFIIRKNLNEHARVDFNIAREEVCERVVVGQQTIPARAEQVVDIVEWHCAEPLLKD